ncbi:MAG: ABC transporter ATP-binding protein [Acidimicrobiales bacterium]
MSGDGTGDVEAALPTGVDAGVDRLGLEAHLDVRRGDLHLDVDLAVGPGEVVALLGPNGAGKTTALHALAGLVPLDGGRIALDREVLDDPATGTFRRPEERPVAIVFQDLLLFPHLRAVDDVAFGLRSRGVPADEARRRALGWLDRLGVGDLADRRPRHLSGGQAQRVALARALATDPALLLLDEPLAALDAGTRATVRRDLRHHLADFGGATVLVTHDPLDALALATQVVVVDGGGVTQAGPIAELTARPRSRYVAELVGRNLLTGRGSGHTVVVDPPAGTPSARAEPATLVVADPVDGEVFALVHPHAVAVHRDEPEGSPRNRWPARIEGLDLLGDRVRIRLTGPLPLVAEVTADAVAALDLHEGRAVWASVKATEIATYPR